MKMMLSFYFVFLSVGVSGCRQEVKPLVEPTSGVWDQERLEALTQDLPRLPSFDFTDVVVDETLVHNNPFQTLPKADENEKKNESEKLSTLHGAEDKEQSVSKVSCPQESPLLDEAQEVPRLSQLKLKGVIRAEGKAWALLEDRQQLIHRVSQGGTLASYQGTVSAIERQSIGVTELVLTNLGCLVPTETFLTLEPSVTLSSREKG